VRKVLWMGFLAGSFFVAIVIAALGFSNRRAEVLVGAIDVATAKDETGKALLDQRGIDRARLQGCAGSLSLGCVEEVLRSTRALAAAVEESPEMADRLRDAGMLPHLASEAPAGQPVEPGAPVESGESAESGEPPGASRTATSESPLELPWYAVFFGYEQYACFLFAGWCLGILVLLRGDIKGEKALMDKHGRSLFPDDRSELRRGEARVCLASFRKETEKATRWRGFDVLAWPSVVKAAAETFASAGKRSESLKAAQKAADASERRLFGRLHVEQYLQWAIPTIGFVGTIRGLSAAMGAAQSASNLPLVVSHLAVAFNSTLTALLLNLGLMFFRALVMQRAESLFGELGIQSSVLVSAFIED